MPSQTAEQLKDKVIKKAKNSQKYLQELLSSPDSVLTTEAGGTIPSDFTLTTNDLTAAGIALPDGVSGGCIKC